MHIDFGWSKVSFNVPNSLASVLGFQRSIYGVGRHAGKNLQHYSFFVHAWYTSSSCLQFFPNATPGRKILDAPHNLIYLPVTVDVISTLSVWLTDQHGNSWIYVERN